MARAFFRRYLTAACYSPQTQSRMILQALWRGFTRDEKRSYGQESITDVNSSRVRYEVVAPSPPRSSDAPSSPQPATLKVSRTAHTFITFSPRSIFNYSASRRSNTQHSMPNIQKLEVYCPYALRIGSMIPTRNSGFEKALLRFASLKKCTDILMDNLADDWIWGASETYESDNKLTAKAAKEMLLTGDHTALDRVQQSWIDYQSWEHRPRRCTARRSKNYSASGGKSVMEIYGHV